MIYRKQIQNSSRNEHHPEYQQQIEMRGRELAHLERGGTQSLENCCFGGKVPALSFTQLKE